MKSGRAGDRMLLYIFLVVLITAGAVSAALVKSHARERNTMEPTKLLVVWTSGDKDVAEKMVFMYTFNAKKNDWWKTVRFLVWGPSSKLLAEDADLQAYLARMKDVGVELTACKACADMYGVSAKLESMGVDVAYMGQPLTDMLKADWKVVTF